MMGPLIDGFSFIGFTGFLLGLGVSRHLIRRRSFLLHSPSKGTPDRKPNHPQSHPRHPKKLPVEYLGSNHQANFPIEDCSIRSSLMVLHDLVCRHVETLWH